MAAILAQVIPLLESKTSTSGFLTILIGIAGSSGIYTGLAKILGALLEHVRPLKKIMLGKYDLQGTWIGMYRARDGWPVYTVEHFEQDLDRLVITGKGFISTGAMKEDWTSIASIIDVTNKKLVYAYTCDRTFNSAHFQGVCVFSLEFPTSTKRAESMLGYSADITSDPRKTENREIRIDDNFLTFKDAFVRAVDEFGGEQDPADQMPARTMSETP